MDPNRGLWYTIQICLKSAVSINSINVLLSVSKVAGYHFKTKSISFSLAMKRNAFDIRQTASVKILLSKADFEAFFTLIRVIEAAALPANTYEFIQEFVQRWYKSIIKEFFINFRKAVQNAYKSMVFHSLLSLKTDITKANFAESESALFKR